MITLFASSFILGLAFCAPPGIITAETIRRGFARGFFPALSVQLGSLIGDTTWAIIALSGLAIIVHNNIARISLSTIGILLLLKLAWDSALSARSGSNFREHQESNYGDFFSGVVLSLSNPLNIVFWAGLGASVFAGIPGGPQWIHFIIFFCGFLGSATLWCFLIASLVTWGRQWMSESFFRLLNATCSIALLYFSFQLGLQTIRTLV
jgi:chemosensory pili system protein ChpE